MSVNTPESKIKKKIKQTLETYGTPTYIHMPVPSGYGAITLDYLCCVNGKFLAIEAKAPGKRATLRQQGAIDDIRAAGGTVLVIDGEAGLDDLRVFLED